LRQNLRLSVGTEFETVCGDRMWRVHKTRVIEGERKKADITEDR
jgi:hypothetical protein